MKLGLAWALVRKELREYRRQRFILTTLLIPPIVLAIIGPIGASLPLYLENNAVDYQAISAFQHPSILTTLGPNNYSSYLANHTVNGVARLDHVHASWVNLTWVDIENSTIENSSVLHFSMNHSIATHNKLTAGVVASSLLFWDDIYSSSLLNDTGLDLRVYETSVSGSPNVQVLATDGLSTAQIAVGLMEAYPLLMAVIPTALPAGIASYALVGEKNNRSLEPLLAAPIRDREILWGKILGVLLPTMGVSTLGFVLLAVVSDLLVYKPLGILLFPNVTWAIALFALAPLLAFMAITLSVVISSRLTDVRSAQEVSSLLVLPIVFLFVAEILTSVINNIEVLSVLAVGLLAIDAVLFLLAAELFQRENILVKWK
ncbi:MAG: ABC transporter permease subunit [Euryarchaeota archaeon]|nr:ABC transporter permease subunit [Euryarchaeota archaeon]MDE2046213.1 ABC transporter permease subunit [Thermoplasmata archaeon]